MAFVGLSPRGRGNHFVRLIFVVSLRSIPAWAGEPETRAPVVWLKAVYPRVGGGTWPRGRRRPASVGSIPAWARGNHGADGHRRYFRRSIPAWAGEPSSPLQHPAATPVYPRVGGGTVL